MKCCVIRDSQVAAEPMDDSFSRQTGIRSAEKIIRNFVTIATKSGMIENALRRDAGNARLPETTLPVRRHNRSFCY
jgi:hypothetical protein